MTNKEIYDLIYSYPCKSVYGFNPHEVKDVLTRFPNINMDKYNNTMMGNTCMMDDGLIITYRCDLLLGINCGLENREPKAYEFD